MQATTAVATTTNDSIKHDKYHLIPAKEKERQERMREVQKRIDKLKRELSREEVDRIEKEHRCEKSK